MCCPRSGWVGDAREAHALDLESPSSVGGRENHPFRGRRADRGSTRRHPRNPMPFPHENRPALQQTATAPSRPEASDRQGETQGHRPTQGRLEGSSGGSWHAPDQEHPSPHGPAPLGRGWRRGSTRWWRWPRSCRVMEPAGRESVGDLGRVGSDRLPRPAGSGLSRARGHSGPYRLDSGGPFV